MFAPNGQDFAIEFAATASDDDDDGDDVEDDDDTSDGSLSDIEAPEHLHSRIEAFLEGEQTRRVSQSAGMFRVLQLHAQLARSQRT